MAFCSMELHSFDLQNQDINPGLITTLFEYGVSCLSDILLVFAPGHRFSNTVTIGEIFQILTKDELLSISKCMFLFFCV